MKDNDWLVMAAVIILVLLTGGGIVVYQRFKTKQDFFNLLKPVADQLQVETGIQPSIVLTQAAVESNYGESQLSNQFHNYFGMKAPTVTDAKIAKYPQLALWASRGKQTANLPTTEEVAGATINIKSDFMAFPDDISGFRYWAELISRLYPYAYSAAKDGDINDFARGLQQMGLVGPYATESGYTKDLVAFNKEVVAGIA